MKIVKRLTIAVGALSVFIGVAAYAEPITLQLDSFIVTGGFFAPIQVSGTTPALPIVGSGDIDFGAGTGILTLPDFYSMAIDAETNETLDSTISVADWQQTITTIAAGAITSTGAGTQSCVDEGGVGDFVCSLVPPAIGDWPPAGGTAQIDTTLKTITVVQPDDGVVGEITVVFSYETLGVAAPAADGPARVVLLLVLGGLGMMALAKARRAEIL